jgi:hypothetical protein
MHAILSTRIILQTRKAASSTNERSIEEIPLSDLHFLTREDFSEGTDNRNDGDDIDRRGGQGECQYQSDVLAPLNQNENV